LHCRSRQATTLRGAAAAEFLLEVDSAGYKELQQIMARGTGNCRRVSVRLASTNPSNR
jgi:hypothetical protein